MLIHVKEKEQTIRAKYALVFEYTKRTALF